MPDTYAYQEAIGEEIEGPARKVHHCLEWLREEYPTADNDTLVDDDQLIAYSPPGEHLVVVQHTMTEQVPDLLVAIAEETGCEVVGTVEQYRSDLDFVETGVWIVPTEVADEYDQETMESATEAWQSGEHLLGGLTFDEATREVAKRTVWFVFQATLTYALLAGHFDSAYASMGGVGGTFHTVSTWAMVIVTILGVGVMMRDWSRFLNYWRSYVRN